MEETVDHDVLRPAPGRESPDGVPVRTDPGRTSRDRAGSGRPDPATQLDRTFGRDEITVVRHEVTARLDQTALGDRLPGFVLAINEVITNVILHAGGHGRIVLWSTPGSVWCTVTDSGPGIPERYRHPPEVPEAFEVGGRGIWLAHQLCDEVTLATGPIGTTIGLRVDVPGRFSTSDLLNGASTSG